MGRRSTVSRRPTAATWNISSPRRSNCAGPPLGYNSRRARTRTRKRQDAGAAVDARYFDPMCWVRADRGRSSALRFSAGSTTTAEHAMSNKGQMLQDPFLNTLRKEHVPVSIYLVNGIKLQGQIESFDQYVVLLKNTVTQMVYKHAISTVVPARPVSVPLEHSQES